VTAPGPRRPGEPHPPLQFGDGRPGPGRDQPPAPFVSTPNAERYLLEADSLRRRQLRSALLHGSGLTWRDRRRIWPAALGGVVLVAVICAAIAVHGAFQMQQQERAEQEREREEQQRELDRQRAPETSPPATPDALAVAGAAAAAGLDPHPPFPLVPVGGGWSG
jgi:hypothetical protein